VEDAETTGSFDSVEDELRRLVRAPPIDPDAFFHSTRAARLEPGDVIDGTFVIRERLGQGGMGVVYRAHHDALGRDVAIKLCRRQISERDTERLRHEAQANAALAHPNIVVVHHVGTMEDQIYLVMEHVDGGTLRQWLAVPRRPWRSIVAKLIEAGRGLAAAHERGLVHRDFKPDNVLIGGDGRARVSDFGLALELTGAVVDEPEDHGTQDAGPSSTSATSTMGRAGTPRYMAPEQHRGDAVSPATDQFAWCVVLYEALSGQHPFEGDCAGPNARRRRNAIPRRVSTRIRAAIERGLSPLASDRHGSMASLLDQVGQEPRWPAVAGVLGLGAIGAAALASTDAEDPCAEPLLERPSWDDDARQQMRTVFTESSLGAGAALAERVEHALDQYLEDWQRTEVEICRDTLDDEALLQARHACLELRAVELESLIGLLEGGEPEVLARSLASVGRLTRPEPCAQDEPSRMVRRAAVDDSAFNEHLVRASTALSSGQVDLAAEHANAAIAAARDDDARARATMMRYRVLDERKDHTAAASEGRQALRLAIASGADEVAAEATRLLVYTTVAGLGEPQLAEQWAGRADAWLTRVGDPARGRVTLDTYRAFILRDTRKYDEAEALLRHALQRARSLEPPRPQLEISAQIGLASTLQRAGHFDKAEAELEASLETISRDLGVDHPLRFGALQMLSAMLWRAGRVEEGIKRSLEVLAGYQRIYGAKSARVGEAEFNLGTNLHARGDLEAAREHTLAALAIFEAHADLKRQGMAVRNLSQLALAAGDLDEALAQATRDVALTRQIDDKPDAVLALVNLTMVHNLRGDAETAYDSAQRVAELASRAFDPTDPLAAFAWVTLGNAAKDVGKLDEARRAFESGIALLRATTGQADPNWVFALAGLADAHYRAGRHDDAVELLLDLDLTPMNNDLERLDATRLLAAAQAGRGDRAGAEHALEQARAYAESVGTPAAAAMLAELEAELGTR